MVQHNQCPSSYETFIDMNKPERSKCVIWIFFNKIASRNIARCKVCDQEFSLCEKRTLLVDHLKENHYHNEGEGFYYSYENYMVHLAQSLHFERHNFPEVQKNNLKISFGVRYAKKFTLVRFPESRKSRTKKSEPKSKSDWNKHICSIYTDNPVGSYQGQFDTPINSKVYNGARPLSFAEYTEFTHSPPGHCNEYVVIKEKYNSLDDLKKIESLGKDSDASVVNIKGPCSKDRDMSLLYTCVNHKCVIPCVCKDCVLEEKQCQNHQILHTGYFDFKTHALTVRSDDSLDINKVRHDSQFNVESKVEVMRYAGIANDCFKCQRDLLHHQAYHLVHHELCKFCRNEKHKYENVSHKRICQENRKFRYEEENCSCHICYRIFNSKQTKDKHVETQHGNESKVGFICDECNNPFQSKVALEYHKDVTHRKDNASFSCVHCKESFKTKHSANVHKRSVHNRRAFYCKKCFLTFKLNSHLLRHYRTVHQLDLKKFTNSVIGEENVHYSCTECDFETMYKQNLTKHLESKHSGSNKEFQCEECGSKFTEKRNLKRHTDKVHGEPGAFECEFCDFKTKFEFNLRRHKDKKHEVLGKGTGIKGRQLYSCRRCDFTTFDENQMYSHNTNIHNIS